MLTVQGLNKRFGKKRAVEDLSLTLQEGHIFGMLGTNGAGKSTLLRMMSGILMADSGSVMLDSLPVYENPAAKRDICYLSDEPAFLGNASIAEMGRMQAAYYPGYSESKLRVLCERFQLPLNERITSFSKGTQKRVQICLGLALNPRVLLCDETFDGLDPVMRDSFKRVLSQETIDRGLITVLAGHNQQEMEDICDSVGFLHEGRLVCSGDLDALLGDVHRVQLIPRACRPAAPAPAAAGQAVRRDPSRRAGKASCAAERAASALYGVPAALAGGGLYPGNGGSWICAAINSCPPVFCSGAACLSAWRSFSSRLPCCPTGGFPTSRAKRRRSTSTICRRP